MDAPASEPATRARQQSSLSKITEAVIGSIRSKHSASSSDVADAVVSALSTDGSDDGARRAMQRRVYDVINVLIAADMIVRDRKTISYREVIDIPGDIELSPSDDLVRKSCDEKMAVLVDQTRILLSYRSLIARNERIIRPSDVIIVPALFMGFDRETKGASRASLNGKFLQTIASATPVFFSPMDIISRMKLPVENRKDMLREYPGLVQYEDIVFKEE